MAHVEKGGVPVLPETHVQVSDELMDSDFRRPVSRTKSASISIPMISMESNQRETSLVGHSGPLCNDRKTSFMKITGPLYDTLGTGNLLQQNIVVTGNKVVESKTEKVSTSHGTVENHWNNNHDRKNEHLRKSGQLGMCDEPYCATCLTYFKTALQRNSKASTFFDPKLHNDLYGYAMCLGRKLFSFCSSYVPGVMNPHTKVVQQWNKFLAIFCMVAIFVDPLFLFLIYVREDYKCIVINWTITKILVLLRSMNDLVYFLNILLQFRLAYVSPESRVVGAGDLVDDPKKIAIRYLQGYFLIDLFVVFPLPQIMILSILPRQLGLSGANYVKNLLRAVILVQYIPRLFRILPLLNGQSPTGFIFESSWANFIINLLMFMLASHVVGSCWYLFGLQRVNQCLRDACRKSNINGCIKIIDCGHGRGNNQSANQTSATWHNNSDAIACLKILQHFHKYSYIISRPNLDLH